MPRKCIRLRFNLDSTGEFQKMAQRAKSILVQSKNYSSEYDIRGDFIHMRHHLLQEKHGSLIDVFGQMNSFTIAHCDLEMIKVRRGDSILKLDSSARCNLLALYIPPFSVIEWDLPQGVIEFEALIKTGEVIKGLPREPLMFSLESTEIPTVESELVELIRGARSKQLIGRCDGSCELSQQVKLAIDQKYIEDVKIEDLAKQFGISHAVMTRKFKKSYGLPPVSYRNRLRVSDSVRRFLEGSKNVAEVGFDVGFQDLSRFNKQFFRQINIRPSSFTKN